jgi:hypothetical protein
MSWYNARCDVAVLVAMAALRCGRGLRRPVREWRNSGALMDGSGGGLRKMTTCVVIDVHR